MESGKIIVVANQKGGVAKTSTVRNLSYALAEMGKKVLVVDFDPQYNLTTSFGVLPTQAPYNTGTLITNLLLDESLPDTNEFIQKIGSVDLIPSSRSLTVAEANLLMTPDSNDYLAALLNPLRLSYDYIITEPTPPQESALKGNKRMSWRTWLGGSLFGISALIIFVLWRLSVRFPISGMTGNGVHLTGFSGFLGFHGILHESYVIVAIGIIGLILLITDFIRIKKNNR